MFTYSSNSRSKLSTCHPDLQTILNFAIKHYDITILEGLRTKERQTELVRTGMSKTMNSLHLDQGGGVSWAVDCALYPIDWNNKSRFVYLQAYLKGVSDVLFDAGKIKHRIVMGVDWDCDGYIKDHSFFDGPHIELKLI